MTAQAPDPGDRSSADLMRAALARELAGLRARLDALARGQAPRADAPEPGSALATLAGLFGLSAAERAVLGLAAGAELDPGVAERVRAQAGTDRPDVSLALALEPGEGWDALCPDAPLRRWRLVELAGSGPMLRRQITVDERVVHFLMGLDYLDARLEGLVDPVDVPAQSGRRAHELEDRVATAWQAGGRRPVILLAGPDGAASRALLARGAARAGLRLLRIDAADIPAAWTERAALASFLDRELALSGAALLIDCRAEPPAAGTGSASAPASAPAPAAGAARLADALVGPVAIAAADPPAPERAPRLRLELPAAAWAERRAIWQTVLGARAEALGSGLDRLAEQFALDRAGVETAVAGAFDGAPVAADAMLGRLWQGARVQARRRLDGLAERIESRAAWDDLVLPADQHAQLRDLADHVNAAWQVNERWGWRARSPRGLGVAALFAGPSGTGKTLAAEVLSAALGLDLFRIDLSQVVSKYIGETEKNLARIFAAAEDGGAILLFDEADALFGKRSEVKDSHDRYANVEVSYLLQRMEAYRGLAVLTTNQKAALDQAFLRRLRHVVTFPFPDAAARAEIWARIFPAETPTEGLDPARLARMNLTGGSIRSIALNASSLAAAAGAPVRPAHIRVAARREYAKLEKPFTASEMEAVT